MKIKQIAILLTCYNRKENTLACLQNLFQAIVPENYVFKVFLIDDGCTDGTAEAVKNQFSDVAIIRGDGDLYWNRGMHLAWTTASNTKEYDFYLWLNDDTFLYDDVLEKLILTSEKNENKTIIVGSTCDTVTKLKTTYGGRRKKDGLIQATENIVRCDYFNGNIVLIPKFVFKKIGINDPVFHHALGDFDYGLRAGKQGVKIYIAPGFLGECDVHERLATWCNPKKTFSQRWKVFRSPLGNNPEEFFIYEKRHNGYLMAIKHYITNHLRFLLPKLWV